MASVSAEERPLSHVDSYNFEARTAMSSVRSRRWEPIFSETSYSIGSKVDKKKFKEISKEWEDIQKTVWLTELVAKTPEEMQKIIKVQQEHVNSLQRQLIDLKQIFHDCKETLRAHEYQQYAKNIAMMESQLAVASASLTEYEAVVGEKVQKIIAAAKETQELCQELISLSKSQQRCVLATYTGVFGELEKVKKTLTDFKDEVAEQSIANTICTEALTYMQQALCIAKKNIDEENPYFFSKKARDAFRAEKKATQKAISGQIGQEDTVFSMLHMGYFGRATHRTQVKKIKTSLDLLEQKSLDLVGMMDPGGHDRDIKEKIATLRKNVETAKAAYEKMQMTYGSKESSAQVAERAVLYCRIGSLEKRLGTIESLQAIDEKLTSSFNATIEFLKKSVYEKDILKRSLYLDEACRAVEELDSLIGSDQIKDPLAKALMEEKRGQLEMQIRQAFPSVDSHLESSRAAYTFACGIQCTEEEKDLVLGFLIMNMLRMTFFEDSEDLSVRALVDLCLLHMDEEKKRKIPQALMQKYQKIECAERQQIDEASSLLQKGREILSKEPFSTTEVNELFTLKKQIEQCKNSMSPALFSTLFKGFERILEAIPVKFTKEEKGIVSKKSFVPSDEDVDVVMSTLEKSIFLSMYAPSLEAQQKAFDDARMILGLVGFHIEYQEKMLCLRQKPLYTEFCQHLPAQSLAFLPQIGINAQTLPTAYSKSPPWFRVVFLDSMSCLPMQGCSKEQIEQLRAKSFFVDFFSLGKKRENCSWKEIGFLLDMYYQLDPKDPETAITKQKLDKYLFSISEKMKKLVGVPIKWKKESSKIVVSESQQTQLQEILIPLFSKSCFGPMPDMEAAKKFANMLTDIVKNAGSLLRDVPAVFLKKYLLWYGSQLQSEVRVLLFAYLIEKNPKILLELDDLYLCILGDLLEKDPLAQKAFETIKTFRTIPKLYQPTQEQNQYVDAVLCAAQTLRVAFGKLGITAEVLFEDIEARVRQMVSTALDKVKDDGEYKKIIEELKELDRSIQQHIAEKDCIACLQDIQKYQECKQRLERVIGKKFPIDKKQIQDHPHVRLVDSVVSKMRDDSISMVEATVKLAEKMIKTSPAVLNALQKGRQYIENQIKEFEGKSPQELQKIIFDDAIGKGLRASFEIREPEEMISMIKDMLFFEMMEKERACIRTIAEGLKQEAFDIKDFRDYETHVKRLYFLSYIRFSGKTYQALTDAQKSEVYQNWHHVLYGDGMKLVASKAGDKYKADIETFERSILEFQKNLDYFQIRLKVKNPVTALEETRVFFEGMVTGMMGKRNLINEAMPKVKDSSVREKLTEVAAILTSFDISADLIKAPSDRRAFLFAKAESLSSEQMTMLITTFSAKLDLSFFLLEEAIRILSKEENKEIVAFLRSIYSQICTWVKMPAQDMLTTAQDKKLRGALLALFEKLRVIQPL